MFPFIIFKVQTLNGGWGQQRHQSKKGSSFVFLVINNHIFTEGIFVFD